MLRWLIHSLSWQQFEKYWEKNCWIIRGNIWITQIWNIYWFFCPRNSNFISMATPSSLLTKRTRQITFKHVWFFLIVMYNFASFKDYWSCFPKYRTIISHRPKPTLINLFIGNQSSRNILETTNIFNLFLCQTPIYIFTLKRYPMTRKQE